MFNLETNAELTCIAHGDGIMFAKKGSMVAYQGEFSFSKVLIDTNSGGLMTGVFNQVMRRATGENMELMEIQGYGTCYLADNAQHVTIINLDNNEPISVDSENLLAFNECCSYGIKFVGAGVISQKGLFTSKITPKNQAAQVAIKSHGNPIILETPCVVDPDAIVCWTGPDPSFKIGVNWKTIIGQSSGESYMLEFKLPGYMVIVQPSERVSGINISIDDKNYIPQEQNTYFENGFSNDSLNLNLNQGGLAGILRNLLDNK